MALTKRLVCLANSRKLNGRCVAGRELVNGAPAGWIRPVSSREHQEVSEYERQYEDGSDPRLLDIIEVPLLRAAPAAYQRENWLLDPALYWEKAGRVSWNELEPFAQHPAELWINGSSTYHGLNDEVRESEARRLDSSLVLLHLDQLSLRVFAPGDAFGNPKRRVQAQFEFSRTAYGLWVTDPLFERFYLAQRDGEHEIGECYLTISLGEPYKGACYKLVAAIIQPPGHDPGGAMP